MDPLIEKLFTVASPLAVLVIVVIVFLRFIGNGRREDRNLFKEMHGEHMDARRMTQEALQENAQSTRENTKAIQSLEVAVKSLDRNRR